MDRLLVLASLFGNLQKTIILFLASPARPRPLSEGAILSKWPSAILDTILHLKFFFDRSLLSLNTCTCHIHFCVLWTLSFDKAVELLTILLTWPGRSLSRLYLVFLDDKFGLLREPIILWMVLWGWLINWFLETYSFFSLLLLFTGEFPLFITKQLILCHFCLTLDRSTKQVNRAYRTHIP